MIYALVAFFAVQIMTGGRRPISASIWVICGFSRSGWWNS